jgi:hypothetical protein
MNILLFPYRVNDIVAFPGKTTRGIVWKIRFQGKQREELPGKQVSK